jgi:prophage regulatory protein
MAELLNPSRAERLEDLLALTIALLAEERGISIEQVRERMWSPAPLIDAPSSGPRLLRLKGLKAKIGFSEAMIYRWVAAGTFPKPKKIGYGSVWLESDIDVWIAARLAEREDRQ